MTIQVYNVILYLYQEGSSWSQCYMTTCMGAELTVYSYKKQIIGIKKVKKPEKYGKYS